MSQLMKSHSSTFRRGLALAGGAAVVAALGTSPDAHHAFAAEFDANKPITLEGTLTKVAWVNPHGWIYIDVPDQAGPGKPGPGKPGPGKPGPNKPGTVTNWSVEFGSPNALLRRGLRKADFPPGIKLTVKGYLAKSGKPVVNASTVTLPDGRSLFAGSSTTPGGQP
jgi:hypothetical protein